MCCYANVKVFLIVFRVLLCSNYDILGLLRCCYVNAKVFLLVFRVSIFSCCDAMGSCLGVAMQVLRCSY